MRGEERRRHKENSAHLAGLELENFLIGNTFKSLDSILVEGFPLCELLYCSLWSILIYGQNLHV
jgi:hypothetical protein